MFKHQELILLAFISRFSVSSLKIIVGSKIRKLRRAKGFSQESFALHAQLDRSYMGRIERGEANITLEIIEQISAVLECEPCELLKED